MTRVNKAHNNVSIVGTLRKRIYTFFCCRGCRALKCRSLGIRARLLDAPRINIPDSEFSITANKNLLPPIATLTCINVQGQYYVYISDTYNL